jgi:hypothetical protein
MKMIDKTEKMFKWNGNLISLENLFCEVGEGWQSLVTNLVEDLIDLGWDRSVAQVKEKFGGLRFYIGEGSDAVHSRIEEAESLSLRICEFCGRPGTPSGRSWVVTRCEEHVKKEKENALRSNN